MAEKPQKKRNRTIISCTSCRRKKIKCNRQKPICVSCKERNYPESACIYLDKSQRPGTISKVSSHTNSEKNRMQILEKDLIVSSVHNSNLESTMGSINNYQFINKLQFDSSFNEDENLDWVEKLQFGSGASAGTTFQNDLKQQLREIEQRKRLLEDFSIAMRPSNNNNGEYLRKQNEFLVKENEILRQILRSKEGKASVEPSQQPMGIMFEKINISSIFAIRFKPNRTIFVGPTCFRSAIVYNENFAKIYHSISKKTTRDRKKFKSVRRTFELSSFFPFNIDNYFDQTVDDARNRANLTHVHERDRKTLAVENEEHLVQILQEFLPNYATLKSHVSAFFDKYLHLLYDFLDYTYIMEIFSSIFVPKSQLDSGPNDFNVVVQHRYRDYSRIALILALMKVSLLYTNKPFGSCNPSFPDESEEKVNSMLSYFTLTFLSLSKMMKRPLITSLQSLILVKIDRMYHHSEGEGGDSSDGQMLFALALNMGIMCGLHRNIDTTYCEASLEYRMMLKKVWNYLVYLDYYQSFDLGYPLSFDDRKFGENAAGTSYSDNMTEHEINAQFRDMMESTHENSDVEEVFMHKFLPIARNLVYQINSLHEKNITLFKLELYLQNFIQFYNNNRFFSPLFESMANPIVQDNQLPKNGLNFIRFIKKIKLQLYLIDLIFTLYNLIFIVLQKFSCDSHCKNRIRLVNYYNNQATNFVVFIVKISKKFMELKTKDRIFHIYLFTMIKKIINRVSNFIYANLLFSYTSAGANAKLNSEEYNNLDAYFHVSPEQVRNMVSTQSGDHITNPTSIKTCADSTLHSICFNKNQYELLDPSTPNFVCQQYSRFLTFAKKDYTYYNFYNLKLELSNMLFDYFFNSVQRTVKGYYSFYVCYSIARYFYKYLKEKKLIQGSQAPPPPEVQVKDEMPSNPAAPHVSVDAQQELGPNMMFLMPMGVDAGVTTEFGSKNVYAGPAASKSYDPLNLLADDFNIDMEDLLNQINYS